MNLYSASPQSLQCAVYAIK